MSGPPFANLVRGQVYVVRFNPPDDPARTIKKYCVNLQKGSIVDNSPTFVAVNITTRNLERIYDCDVFLSPEESGTSDGAKVICSQIYTHIKAQIQAAPYRLSQARMEELDKKLLLGVGIIKTEDLRS